MSAHSASHRRGWLSALVAQVSEYVFEEVEETIEPAPAELKPQPVVAVVAATPRSGTTTVARLLAAELASRAGSGAAVVVGSERRRRTAPPSRAAIRLATALTGVAAAQPVGRLCLVAPADAREAADGRTAADAHSAAGRVATVNAARYLGPVVIDVPADGSGAGLAAVADRVAVLIGADGEPALLDAVAGVIGGDVLKVVNRVTDSARWADRADLLLPDSRITARAAAMGTRALGPLGSAIHALADALEAPR